MRNGGSDATSVKSTFYTYYGILYEERNNERTKEKEGVQKVNENERDGGRMKGYVVYSTYMGCCCR